jgi:hypothetical protein
MSRVSESRPNTMRRFSRRLPSGSICPAILQGGPEESGRTPASGGICARRGDEGDGEAHVDPPLNHGLQREHGGLHDPDRKKRSEILGPRLGLSVVLCTLERIRSKRFSPRMPVSRPPAAPRNSARRGRGACAEGRIRGERGAPLVDDRLAAILILDDAPIGWTGFASTRTCGGGHARQASFNVWCGGRLPAARPGAAPLPGCRAGRHSGQARRWHCTRSRCKRTGATVRGCAQGVRLRSLPAVPWQHHKPGRKGASRANWAAPPPTAAVGTRGANRE